MMVRGGGNTEEFTEQQNKERKHQSHARAVFEDVAAWDSSSRRCWDCKCSISDGSRIIMGTTSLGMTSLPVSISDRRLNSELKSPERWKDSDIGGEQNNPGEGGEQKNPGDVAASTLRIAFRRGDGELSLSSVRLIQLAVGRFAADSPA